MIKIAYIITPITYGGAEKVSLNFLKAVNRKKYQINPILLIRPWEGDNYFIRELRKYGYVVETIPVAVNKTSDPLRVLRVVYRIYKILSRSSIHLVHTHGYFADICGLPVAKLLGIPSISTCHGYISNDKKLEFYNFMDKIALRLCRKVISVSSDIRDDLINSGLSSSRIIVIHNAVGNSLGENEISKLRFEKRNDLSIDPNEFVVGFVGRLSVEKGLVYLIEAVSELKKKYEEFKIIIIGDGPAREDLERLVSLRGLERNIIFYGFQENIEEWFPIFDTFVLPSLTEGTPLAVLESMSLGIPVIASAVGGIPQVIQDGINGLLVPPGDSLAICERIQMMKNKSELRMRLGRNAVATVKREFNIQDWSYKLEQEYDSLTA